MVRSNPLGSARPARAGGAAPGTSAPERGRAAALAGRGVRVARAARPTRAGRSALLAVGILQSAPACASDPTGLWVLFVAFPALALAGVALLLAWLAPRFGVVFAALLALAHVPVVNWSSLVGYMRDEGWMLVLSFVASVVALAISIGRVLPRPPSRAPGRDWRCLACDAVNDGAAAACAACGCPCRPTVREIERARPR